MTRKRCVVLGDVSGSRDIDDREAFGERFRGALDAASSQHAADLVADFAPLKGVDEFGGVLAGPRPLYRVVETLQAELRPAAFRVAAVVDEVDVNPDAGDVAAMDGPAFHRASDRLESLAGTGPAVSLAVAGSPLDELLAAATDLALTIRSDWTDREFDAVQAYRETGTQSAAAETLGVSQQAVSRALKRARWDRVSAAGRAVDEALDAVAAGEVRAGG